tara:strand:- start:118366 stop:118815 length:450 start_codon:yes stop_codon:yes gene_type:complete
MKEQRNPGNNVTILLVDDDDVDVMGVERAMKKLNMSNPLVRARDGEEGLALLRDSRAVPRPYIILLDINMPRMNGLEMLAEIRKDPRLHNDVVFILTTSRSHADKLAAYQQKVAGYMVKSRVGDGVLNVMAMLQKYCLVVEPPSQESGT